MVRQDDPRIDMCAYAKLVGDGVEYYVRKYEVILGRASKSGQTDVVLGDNMNISRQHAKITYNSELKGFELVVLGKNGVTVGTTLYTPASNPYLLKSQDLMMVADKVFHFLLPKPVASIKKRDWEELTSQAAKRPRHMQPMRPAPAPRPVQPVAAVAMPPVSAPLTAQPPAMESLPLAAPPALQEQAQPTAALAFMPSLAEVQLGGVSGNQPMT